MKSKYSTINKDQLIEILAKAKTVGDSSDNISATELVDFIQTQLLWIMDGK